MRSDAAGSLLRPSFLAASRAEFKRFEDRAVRRAVSKGLWSLRSPYGRSLRPLGLLHPRKPLALEDPTQ